jgi:hypothetical protein
MDHMTRALVRLGYALAVGYVGTFVLVVLIALPGIIGIVPFRTFVAPTFLDPIIRFTPVVGTPFVLGAAWRVRRDVLLFRAKWRAVVVTIALVAVTVNAALFYGWVIYFNLIIRRTGGTMVWHYAGLVGGWLVLAAFVLALVGKGPPRLLVACASVMGLIVWVPIIVF